MPLKPGAWCYRCGAYEHEPAADNCSNPGWHTGIAAPAEPVPPPPVLPSLELDPEEVRAEHDRRLALERSNRSAA